MITFKQLRESLNTVTEGGNVFAGRTGPIKLENIKPTMDAYFEELKKIFPKKKAIFNDKTFNPLGSVGKKAVSGDIDLGVDSKDILDKEMSDKSVAEWNIDPVDLKKEFDELSKRARTSTPAQLRLKAFLKLLAVYINKKSTRLNCDEKKVTDGNIFFVFPQIDEKGKELDIGVQMDWMVGNIEWLKFSYYSAAYPKDSNVKGLHRTQLMLAAFQVANMSFNHVTGVKDKETGKIIAQDAESALGVLGKKLGFTISRTDAEDYFKLHKLLKDKLKPADYQSLLKIYLKILDSTRADIPSDMQADWIKLQKEMGFKGKFLPDDSALKKYATEETIQESGSAGGERIKSRADYAKFVSSFESVIKHFPGFESLETSGSFNSDKKKESFGDIDAIISVTSSKDKAQVKKDLVDFFLKKPESVITPFTSDRYKGKRTLNTGEIVTVRFFDNKLGYAVQIDSIIALSKDESYFKKSFLDLPAEKQGLVLGLVKVALIENKPEVLLKKMGINVPMDLRKDEEYEFNLSSVELSLRKVKYKPGTKEQESRETIWTSKKFSDIEKVLFQYDLSVSFDDLLNKIKTTTKNPRSPLRIKGVFNSMVSIKSGEVGTPKGDNKQKALDKVDSVLS
jgi:hypothetical protein